MCDGYLQLLHSQCIFLPCEVSSPSETGEKDCKRCVGGFVSCLTTLFQHSFMLLPICNCILNFPSRVYILLDQGGNHSKDPSVRVWHAVSAATVPLGKACCLLSQNIM